jgi:hypothetical protein
VPRRRGGPLIINFSVLFLVSSRERTHPTFMTAIDTTKTKEPFASSTQISCFSHPFPDLALSRVFCSVLSKRSACLFCLLLFTHSILLAAGCSYISNNARQHGMAFLPTLLLPPFSGLVLYELHHGRSQVDGGFAWYTILERCVFGSSWSGCEIFSRLSLPTIIQASKKWVGCLLFRGTRFLSTYCISVLFSLFQLFSFFFQRRWRERAEFGLVGAAMEACMSVSLRVDISNDLLQSVWNYLQCRAWE